MIASQAMLGDLNLGALLTFQVQLTTDESLGSASSTLALPEQAEMTREDEGGGGDKKKKRPMGGTNERDVTPHHSSGSSGKLRGFQSIDDAQKSLMTSQIRGLFHQVEGGLINLIKQRLIDEQPLFSSAALCGDVDHFESVGKDDLGWGCGWRNIQMLCSYLLAELPETREVLFNGAGFVPDIAALQRWLEIAWMRGFDEAGAGFFNWDICGTDKWIGTTECAALLRSFGIRARIVSFSALGEKRPRTGNSPTFASGEFLNESVNKVSGKTQSFDSRGGADMQASKSHSAFIECDECGQHSSHGVKRRDIVNQETALCTDCMEEWSQERVPRERSSDKNKGVVELGSKIDPTDNGHLKQQVEHQIWEDLSLAFECSGCGRRLMQRRYKSLMRKRFSLCSECMKDVDEHPNEERGSAEDYVFVEKFPPSRDIGRPQPGDDSADMSEDTQSDQSVADEEADKEDHEKTPRMRDRISSYLAEAKMGGRGGEEGVGRHVKDEVRAKAGTGHGVEPGNRAINHQHFVEWVWNYFTEESSESLPSGSPLTREPVVERSRSPLYFQQRGHSRTIVGIERQRNSTGISEDVFFLVLDPAEKTERIQKALRDITRWQKYIKINVSALKETAYQLCYAAPGIAVGEEQEELKVLSSLQYSYYSK